MKDNRHRAGQILAEGSIPCFIKQVFKSYKQEHFFATFFSVKRIFPTAKECSPLSNWSGSIEEREPLFPRSTLSDRNKKASHFHCTCTSWSFFLWCEKRRKMKKRRKEEETVEGNYGPPNRKVVLWPLWNLNQAGSNILTVESQTHYLDTSIPLDY